MDAAQLTLLFSSRAQASSRSVSRADDNTAQADKAFSSVLKQRVTEHDEKQRKLDTGRQYSRRQASSPAPVSAPSISAASSSHATATISTAAKSPAVSAASSATQTLDSQDPADSQPEKETSSQEAQTQKGPEERKQTETVSATKADKDAKPSSNDENQPADDQQAASIGHIAVGSQDAQSTAPVIEGDGSSANNNSQNQDSDQKDNEKKKLADSTDGNIDAVQIVAITIGVPLVNPIQSASGSDDATVTSLAAGSTNPASVPTTADNLVPTNTPAAATDTASANGPTATNNHATAATQGQLGNSPTLPVPDPGSSSNTTNTQNIANAQQVSPAAVNGVLLQTPSIPLTSAQETAQTDPEADFAEIVAKKLDSAPVGNDNLRVSVTKTTQNDGPQIPRPLIRIDGTHLASNETSTQPTASVTQTEPSSTTKSIEPAVTDVDAVGSLDFQNGAADGLRAGYSPFSSFLPGNGTAVAGKPADILTELRQQLSTSSLQDQVAIHMQRAMKDSIDKISIQLSPTELGRIHVKMNVDDDKRVSATITVERPATLELLQRDTKALERALQEAGLRTDSGSLSFSLQRGNQGDFSDSPGWGQGGRQIGSSGQEKSAAVTEASAPVRNDEIDTANGLVNVAV